jgi:hypothetical protein
MAKYIFICMASLLVTLAQAQNKKRDSGLILLLGPSVTYYYGTLDAETTYSDYRMSWQFDGQFGFISTRNQSNRGNMLLAFGSLGNAKPMVVQDMLNASNFDDKVLDEEQNTNLYYTVEGGMIIMKFLRLSGGIGRQRYTNGEGNIAEISHYMGTGGFNFDFGAVNLGLNASVLSGNDLVEPLLRFSAGFLVKF